MHNIYLAHTIFNISRVGPTRGLTRKLPVLDPSSIVPTRSQKPSIDMSILGLFPKRLEYFLSHGQSDPLAAETDLPS